MQISKKSAAANKAAAILMIILCHSVGSFCSGIRVFTPLGGIGVAVFLILSGYGLNESWKAAESTGQIPWRGWWRKRFSTILPLYWLTQLLCCWILQRVSPSRFLLDLLLLKPLHPYGWYLRCLLIWYLAFYCLRRFRFLWEHRIVFIVLLAAALFAVQSPLEAEQVLSFPVGLLLSERKNLFPKGKAFRQTALLVLIGTVFLALKQFPALRASPQPVMNCIQLLIKLPCGLGVVILGTRLLADRSCPPLELVGGMSFELYLAHGYLLQWVPKNLPGFLLFLVGSAVFAAALWLLDQKTKPLLRRALQI